MEDKNLDRPTRYHPLPREKREGIALCLSGGGYRAALFHLGGLRRLHEVGLLDRVRTISSVSGGSIMSAHLAARLAAQAEEGRSFAAMTFETDIAAPFRRFAARDIRTGPLLQRFLLPWNWFRRSTQVRALERLYYKYLSQLKLYELPPQPDLVFCATDIGCGVNWEFRRTRVGDYQLGYGDPPATWTLAKAVAASSCFPPVFDPMSAGLPISALSGWLLRNAKLRASLIGGLRLSDGGVYDNLGLEPVWEDHAVVLVSDGGAPFRAEPATTVIRQWKRYVSIAGNQVAALRKRWLISNFEQHVLEGTYWGIGSAVSRYGRGDAEGYSKQLALDVISRVRTDLDGFSEAEMDVLENHGYTLAEVALRVHAPSLVPDDAPAPRLPHPEWSDEAAVRSALAKSDKRIRWL